MNYSVKEVRTDMGPSTDNLLKQLKNSTDIEKYREQNKDAFWSANLRTVITQLKKKYRVTNTRISVRSGISTSYINELTSRKNTKVPERDMVISLLIGIGASLSEIQESLEILQYARLHPRSMRDSDIIYGIMQHFSVFEIDEQLLIPHGEKPLRIKA